MRSVHVSAAGDNDEFNNLNVNSTHVAAHILLDLNGVDPRTQSCGVWDSQQRQWVEDGLIFAGVDWDPETKTLSAICLSSHLSDFSTSEAAIELPEMNRIDFATDFALIERYNPSNFAPIIVLAVTTVFFLILCGCAYRWQEKRYEKAVREFEFVNYRVGASDFEGEDTPPDVNRAMFLLDASVHLRDAVRTQLAGKETMTSERCEKTKACLKVYLAATTKEHAWISILSSPPAHPFTPVQRLWVTYLMTLTNCAVIGLFFWKRPVESERPTFGSDHKLFNHASAVNVLLWVVSVHQRV